MRCLNCNQVNVELARFCSQCGAPLSHPNEQGKKTDTIEPRYTELIDKKDKLLFLSSVAGGAILAIVGLVLSQNLVIADPLLSKVFLYLSFLIGAYIIATSTVLIIRVLQYLKKIKTAKPENGSDAEVLKVDGSITHQNQLRDKHNQLKEFGKLRIGGVVFAAFILIALIIAVLLPRPQYKIHGLTIPREFIHGEQLFVVADVENYGRAEGNLLLTLFVNDKEAQGETVILEAGSKKNYQIDLSGIYRPGTYDVVLGLGDSKLIDQREASQLRILTAPKLVINYLKIEHNHFDFNEKQDTVIIAEVANLGEAAGQKAMELYVDDNLERTSDVSLEGGATKRIDFPLTVEGPGSYNISINGISEILEVFNIEQPRNGYLLDNKISGGSGHLKVINDYGVDAVFIFVKDTEPSNSLLAVYVHANSTATVRGIRDGNYLGYYSTGLDWDNHSRKFTRFADHGRYEDVFNYSTSHRTDGYLYSIWTLTFGSTDPGEMASTQYVSPNNFPSIVD